MTRPFAITVFNAAMVPQGRVDDFEYFKWERNWYTPDEWTLNINRSKPNSAFFDLGYFIGYPSQAGYFIGIIETIELPLDEQGKASEQYTISGKGIESILSTRIALYGTGAATGYDIQTAVSAETAIKHYVYYNCIATGVASRNFSGLTNVTDTTRGADVEYQARFQIITDILEEICRATELSYFLTWSGSGLYFTFDVREGTDVSDTVTISPEFDNVATFQFSDSWMDMKNLIYIGDAGTAAARTIYGVYLGSEPTGWSRREGFVDGSDLTGAAQFADKGEQMLAEYSETVTLETDYYPSGTFVYGTDFNLGDIVTVVYPGITIVVSRILSISEETTPESGEKLALKFGKERPDLKGVFKTTKRALSPAIRR